MVKGAVTLNKYLGHLSRYWQWMEHREHAASNVWRGIKITPPPAPHNELERAFTHDEMVALLDGPATPAMHDLMRIAALTGARLDAIVDLKVGDCLTTVFLCRSAGVDHADAVNALEYLMAQGEIPLQPTRSGLRRRGGHGVLARNVGRCRRFFGRPAGGRELL